MIRLERILVPTDFSEYSYHALDYAAEFARQFQARIYLLHVVEEVSHDPAYFTPYVSPEVFRQRAEEYCKKKFSEIDGRLGGLSVEALIRFGIPYLEIIQAARDLAADCIVISTHGRTGLAHLLLGSTTERVVRQAPCPVMSVKLPEHEFVAPSEEGRRA